MKEKTRAYMAGIFDAEGCFSIKNSNNKNRPSSSFRTSISLKSTSLDLAKWLVSNFGGVFRYIRSQSSNLKDTYDWMITNQIHGKSFISCIYPYLILKKEEAECVLKYYKAKTSSEREKILLECRNLKHQDYSLDHLETATTETLNFSALNLDRAYLAGFIDGEGCISIKFQEGAGFACRLQVTNTNPLILKRLQELYGGRINLHSIPTKETHRHSYRWSLENLEAIEKTLLGLLPYLIIKHDHTNVALNFVRMKREQNPEKRFQLYLVLKKLNQRGKNIQSELIGDYEKILAEMQVNLKQIL